MMQAGKLRKRLLVKNPVETTDAQGGQVITWPEAGYVWGSLRPINSREAYLHYSMRGNATHEIRVRWTPKLTLQSKLFLGAREFSVVSLKNTEERNAELILMCEEKQP